MDLTSIVFAFTAGFIAFFSPCAFPMLPAYISYYLGLIDQKDNNIYQKNKIKLFSEGVIGGISCAIGAISVLLIIGIGISMLGNAVRELIKENIAIIEPIVGVILIIMGFVMIFGLSIKIPIKKSPSGKGNKSLFVYGILYALVAAGCTAPIFISVIIRAFASSSFFDGILIFLSYAMGLGILLIIITIIITTTKNVILSKIKKILPHIQRLGAIVLITVGIWLIYYYYSILII
jgi:cytochrome c-type biogenesis protein